MATPLELYKDIAKKFNITVEKQVHPRQQIAFVSEQANQQKAIIHRLICDTAAATADLEDAKDDATKAAYQKKVSEYEGDLRQLTKSLDFFLALEADLTKANPGVESGPYPEGA